MQGLLTAALLCALGASAMGQGGRNSGDASAEQEIRQRLRVWDQALEQRDAATLAGLLADDYRLTDASGAVLNKGQYLMSVVKSPDFSRVTSYASEEVTVHITGDKAVVTGRSPVKGRARGKGQAFSGNYRFTDQWVREAGAWKAKATTATHVSPARVLREFERGSARRSRADPVPRRTGDPT